MVVFEIKSLSPETYRQQTRRSTLIVAVTFAVLAMGLATLAVALFGETGADNLKWNIAGVVAGLLVTAALVRFVFLQQPWMSCSAYGWNLKRSLMSVTNVMHHVTAGVAADDQAAALLSPGANADASARWQQRLAQRGDGGNQSASRVDGSARDGHRSEPPG